MKYCEYCGNELQDQAAFCVKCGAAVRKEDYSALNSSSKSKLTCGLLQIFLGGFGVGRFYSGHTGIAVAQLIVTIVTCGAGLIWGFIDGIVILASQEFRDAEGKVMRE
jgi:TM2 domain-containing membrane protein YozV